MPQSFNKPRTCVWFYLNTSRPTVLVAQILDLLVQSNVGLSVDRIPRCVDRIRERLKFIYLKTSTSSYTKSSSLSSKLSSSSPPPRFFSDSTLCSTICRKVTPDPGGGDVTLAALSKLLEAKVSGPGKEGLKIN